MFRWVERWMGYVGDCVTLGEPTCRPFWGIVAIVVVTVGALVLAFQAYGALIRWSQGPRENAVPRERVEPGISLQ